MFLPECQQPPAEACSKDAPDRPPMREEVGACGATSVSPPESFGRTLASSKNRERCGSRASFPVNAHIPTCQSDGADFFACQHVASRCLDLVFSRARATHPHLAFDDHDGIRADIARGAAADTVSAQQ